MWNSLILFAQEEGAKPEKQQPEFWQNPIVLLPVFMFLFYFLVMRPQQRKQRQEQDALMNSLKKNDEVQTAAGIIAIVHQIHEGGQQVTLKIDDNGARMRVLRSSIVKILTPPAPAAPPPAAPSSTGITNKPNA